MKFAIGLLLLVFSGFSGFAADVAMPSTLSPDETVNSTELATLELPTLLINAPSELAQKAEYVQLQIEGDWHPCSSDEFSAIPKPGMIPTTSGGLYRKPNVTVNKAHGKAAMWMCARIKKVSFNQGSQDSIQTPNERIMTGSALSME